jgi:hypothetical protein
VINLQKAQPLTSSYPVLRYKRNVVLGGSDQHGVLCLVAHNSDPESLAICVIDIMLQRELLALDFIKNVECV